MTMLKREQCFWIKVMKLQLSIQRNYEIFLFQVFSKDRGQKQSSGGVQNSQENTGLRPPTSLKKRLWHRCFPVNFAKFIRTPLFAEQFRWLLLRSVFRTQSNISDGAFCENSQRRNAESSILDVWVGFYWVWL